jgi:ATP-binding cassette subfamily B protein
VRGTSPGERNLSGEWLRLTARFLKVFRLKSDNTRRRIPVVHQLAATDCGAAALAMVLQYHGVYVGLDEIRRALGVGRNGISITALLRTARLYGLRGRGVRAEIEDLHSLPVGTILHWQFHHYVVLESIGPTSASVVDPACGRRIVSLANFRRAFTGVALILEPSEAFASHPAKPKGIWGLLRIVFENRNLLFRILSISAIIQILSAAMPLVTGMLIDRVVPNRDYSLLFMLATAYLGFQVFNALAGFIRAHLFIHFQTQLETSFTLGFLDHLVELPYSFFQQRAAGDLMMRLGSNKSVREILSSTSLSTVMDGLMVGLYLILLLFESVTLTAMVVGLAFVRVLLVIVMRQKQREYLADNLELSARSQTYEIEMLSGMETLKAMGLEQRAAEHWSSLFVDGLNISIRRGRLEAIFAALQNITTVRLNVEENQLVNVFGEFCVCIGSLKSA